MKNSGNAEKGKKRSTFDGTLENFWLILNEIKLWAQKNKYQVKEKEMI
jgi:hypothetical protein